MLLPSQESQAFCFVGVRGVRQGLDVSGVGMEGTLYKTFALQCSAVCVAKNLA